MSEVPAFVLPDGRTAQVFPNGDIATRDPSTNQNRFYSAGSAVPNDVIQGIINSDGFRLLDDASNFWRPRSIRLRGEGGPRRRPVRSRGNRVRVSNTDTRLGGATEEVRGISNSNPRSAEIDAARNNAYQQLRARASREFSSELRRLRQADENSVRRLPFETRDWTNYLANLRLIDSGELNERATQDLRRELERGEIEALRSGGIAANLLVWYEIKRYGVEEANRRLQNRLLQIDMAERPGGGTVDIDRLSHLRERIEMRGSAVAGPFAAIGQVIGTYAQEAAGEQFDPTVHTANNLMAMGAVLDGMSIATGGLATGIANNRRNQSRELNPGLTLRADVPMIFVPRSQRGIGERLGNVNSATTPIPNNIRPRPETRSQLIRRRRRNITRNPQQRARRAYRRRLARVRRVGAMSADTMLEFTIRGLSLHWTAPRGGNVYITPGGQLVGSHRVIRLFSRAHRSQYFGWHSHHIVEEVHLRRLGIRDLFRTRAELPCVLLPPGEHVSRIGTRLKQANRGDPNISIVREAYQEAYTTMLGGYTGSSPRTLGRELLTIVRAMFGD